MAVVARLAGLGQTYLCYIVAYSWTTVPVIALMTAPKMMQHLGLLDAKVSLTATMMVFFFSLYFSWYIARTGLEVSGPGAFAIVLGEVAVGQAILMMIA